MEITAAEFISSYSDVKKCPSPDRPEFAFIGRSNVGKSSLVNMLTNLRHLAKTSTRPGKTQTINHFLINKNWYLVDLPGYGYASVSRELRQGFGKMIEQYILQRENLYCLFILIDLRLDPQEIDQDFIQWCGTKEIPLALVFTKSDKLTKNHVNRNFAAYQAFLRKSWDELPPMIISSATEKRGRDELLLFIEKALADAD